MINAGAASQRFITMIRPLTVAPAGDQGFFGSIMSHGFEDLGPYYIAGGGRISVDGRSESQREL